MRRFTYRLILVLRRAWTQTEGAWLERRTQGSLPRWRPRKRSRSQPQFLPVQTGPSWDYNLIGQVSQSVYPPAFPSNTDKQHGFYSANIVFIIFAINSIICKCDVGESASSYTGRAELCSCGRSDCFRDGVGVSNSLANEGSVSMSTFLEK